LNKSLNSETSFYFNQLYAATGCWWSFDCLIRFNFFLHLFGAEIVWNQRILAASATTE
jgi:hypothetical protein